MNKFVCGIRARDTGFVRSWTVVDDVNEFIRDVRATFEGKVCAYNLFPEQYEIVSFPLVVPTSCECIELFRKEVKED